MWTSMWFHSNLIVLCLLQVQAANNTNRTETEHLEHQQRFCGSHLSRALATFCDSVPSPSLYRRRRRQIVEECCVLPCSMKHLINNYCQVVNSTAIETYKQIYLNATMEAKNATTLAPHQVKTRNAQELSASTYLSRSNSKDSKETVLS